MRIDPKGTICGLPSLDVRAFLIKRSKFRISNASSYFKIDLDSASRFLHEMVAEKYLDSSTDPKAEFFQRTMKGNALRIASAAKPIHRKTADKKVAELLKRAKQINAKKGYVYAITHIGVFGSYLTESEVLSDIDLFIVLESKFKTHEETHKAERKFSLKNDEGISLRKCYIDELFWAKNIVKWKLRKGDGFLSFHEEEEVLELKTPFKILFEKKKL